MAAEPTHRLFLALWPPPEARDALVQHQSAWRWSEGTARVRPERLHVTLHFIGAVPQSRVAEVVPALQVPFTPFELDLSQGRPRAWHGGLAVLELHAPPALLRLHQDLAQALERAGLPLERRAYRPHVTLARRAFGATPAASSPATTWQVREGYALVRTLPAGGYEGIGRYA